jgi:hypothetical protein
LNRIIIFLIHSNLIISLSGGILTYGIARHFSLEHNWKYSWIVTLLIFSVYTLQRIVDKSGGTNVERVSSVTNQKKSFIASVIVLIVAIFLGLSVFNNNPVLIIWTLVFSVICYWYTVPLFGKKLREIPGVKIIVTAITWSYACAFFPLINEGVLFEQAGLFSIILLFYLVAIILPFDIRDVHTDDLNQSTVPQIIGIIPTKLFGAMLLVVFSELSINCGFVTRENWMFHIAVLLQLFFLIFTSEKRTILYFTLIDLLIILLGLSYFL